MDTGHRVIHKTSSKIVITSVFSSRQEPDPELLVPTLRSKFEDWPMKKVKPEILDRTSDECSGILAKAPKPDDYPTVFVSPENRGFDLAEMFSVHVDIPLEHPAGQGFELGIAQFYHLGKLVSFCLSEVRQVQAWSSKPGWTLQTLVCVSEYKLVQA